MASLAVEASGNSGNLYHGWDLAYADAHDAVNADGIVTTSANGIDLGQWFDTNEFFVDRLGLIFDTSSIPSNAEISAATLSLYGYGNYSDTDFDITIVSGDDLADTLVVADFGDLLNAVTSFGELNSSSWQLEAYNDITLNATGIAAIVKAGTTRFGLRSSRDISNTSPQLNGANNLETVGSYDANTADKKPKLTITYTSFVPRVIIID